MNNQIASFTTKEILQAAFLILLVLVILSIPLAMAVGKYQVCSNYFPEINRYACIFTNLPPYTGVKK